MGRNVDALKTPEQARALDCVSPVVLSRLAVAYLWTNDNVRAEALNLETFWESWRGPDE